MYVEDIPFLSSAFYSNNDARTLSDSFFLESDPMVEFHLFYIYCQLNKNLGRIGSAFKTLERLETILQKTEKVNPKTAYSVQNGNATNYEGLRKARNLLQEEFLIADRQGLLREDENSEIYDMKKHGMEVLIYYLTRATLSFYLGSYNESFASITEALRYFSILHQYQLPGFDYKKAAILERELVSILCEVTTKYAQTTLAKDIIDVALNRVEAALKIVDYCKDIIQEDISVSNIYLNRSLCDLYLFKGLHGFCENSLLKAEGYLRKILKVSLVGFEEVEAGAWEKQGEVSENMLKEGKCAKNQEVIYDSLYNLALIHLNLARRGVEAVGYLQKARNLVKFGLKNFENNSPFWLLYAFTEESEKRRKAALLSGLSADPEVSKILSHSYLKF